MNLPVLYLAQIPQCQFCDLPAKYQAASTNPESIHNWVYVCQTDLSANAVDNPNSGNVKLIQLVE
jgi:hypothetical protein